MNMDVITIQSLAGKQNIPVDYIDEDLLIIDNVKDLAEPSPTRVVMNFIVACTAGRVQAQMNGSPFELSRNQVLLAPPNVMLSDFLISPDFEFKAVFFTTRLLQSFLRDKINVWNEILYIRHDHILTLDNDDIGFFFHFYDMLRLCIDGKVDNPYRTDIIQSLMRSAFLGLCGTLKMKLPETSVTTGEVRSSAGIFRAFLDLLGAGQMTHRTVDSFADELHITPKYLSTVCKKHSGKTAGEWITEKIMDEINFYLKQTDLPIKQIADRLGFANPSFFGKYVKEHFGKTPTQIRQQP